MLAAVMLWAWMFREIGMRDENMGKMYLLVTGFCFVLYSVWFNSGGERKGPSAYSFLNEDGYRLPGTFTADDFDSQLRRREQKREKLMALPSSRMRPHYDRSSKAANKPCVCGSGRKYKKCCGRPGARGTDDIFRRGRT